ncbi:MAG: replication initiation protein [Candidatus Thiodiazotropha sp. L084R]
MDRREEEVALTQGDGQVDEACQDCKKKGALNVCKSNMLIEANYKLNLVEHRIILACLAKLDSRKPIPESITFTAQEYVHSFNTPLKQAYLALENGSKGLHERTLGLRDKSGKTRRQIRWLQGPVTRLEYEAEIVLRFSEVVKPHLTLLHQCFTVYELEKVANLQSTYSIRLYELLIQWRSTHKLFIRVEAFKEHLGLEDQYQKFKNLKRWVIDPAVKELQEKSGLKIRWAVQRRGRKAVTLVFNFKEKSLPGSKLARFPSKEERSSSESEPASEANTNSPT